MEILAIQIKRELEKQIEKIGHCAIHEEELQRVWPLFGQTSPNEKAYLAFATVDNPRGDACDRGNEVADPRSHNSIRLWQSG